VCLTNSLRQRVEWPIKCSGNKIVTFHGIPSMSGWISVFAVFDKDGEWQGDKRTISNWPIIEIRKVPSGAISFPVQFDDSGIKFEGCMMAGQFAFDGEGTGIQPRSDWCLTINGLPKHLVQHLQTLGIAI